MIAIAICLKSNRMDGRIIHIYNFNLKMNRIERGRKKNIIRMIQIVIVSARNLKRLRSNKRKRENNNRRNRTFLKTCYDAYYLQVFVMPIKSAKIAILFGVQCHKICFKVSKYQIKFINICNSIFLCTVYI